MRLTTVLAACCLLNILTPVGSAQALQWGLQHAYTLSNSGANSVAVSDINNDSIPDVVVGSNTVGQTVWVGLGQTGGVLNITSQNLGTPGSSPVLGHFLGDANVDLAFITGDNVSGGALEFSAGSGTSAFAFPQSPLGGSAVVGLVSADFNQDGFQDLASLGCPGASACSTATRAVKIFLADGFGGFLLPIEYPVLSSSAHDISCADLNLDGNLDLIIVSDGSLSVLQNDGSGHFTTSNYGRGNQACHVAVADFDGDGRGDLALQVNGGLEILWGVQGNLFSTGPTLMPSTGTWFEAADLDGDSIPDIAASTGGSSGNVALLHGLGAGAFAAPVILPFSGTITSFHIANVEGDQRPEILVVGGNQLKVYEDQAADCNGNGVDDSVDIQMGTSADCDSNGIPDSCQTDCDQDGLADACEILGTPSLDLNGNGMLDSCEPTGTGYCFGDGTGSLCPCDPGQAGAIGRGCMNSGGTGGLLSATGNPSVLADSVTLHASGLLMSSVGLFFQGNSQQAGGIGSLFGDGLLCVNQAVLRLGIRGATAGTISLGAEVPGDVALHLAGQIPPSGGIRRYQLWYRDPFGFCTPSTFNLTNGLAITWTP
jgi:hypothetical protein